MELRSGRTKKSQEDDVVDDYCREYVIKPGEKDQLRELVKRSRWWVSSLADSFKLYVVVALIILLLICAFARIARSPTGKTQT